MLTTKINKSIAITALLLLCVWQSYSQTYTISGPTSVNAGQTYTYTVSNSIPSNFTWNGYYGDISSASSFSCNVTWRCGMTTGTVYIKNNFNGTAAYLDVTINQNPPLTGGAVSPGSQSIKYNSYAPITCTPATGLTCSAGSYNYQWYSSTDGSNYAAISGATSQDYTPNFLTAPNNYFKRGVTRAGSGEVFSNVATVTVFPQLVLGSVSPSSQTINYNSAPGTLTSSGATGGNNSYFYQWQVSNNPDPIYFNNISGANGLTYSPGNLASTTYYRLVVISDGVSVSSNIVTVNVNTPLSVGNITPSAVTIANNTSPGALTSATPSGGNGTYAYQWYSSTDNTTYAAIPGAQSQSYTPGNLTQTMYYKVQVSSNGVSVFSNIAVVTVTQTVGVPAATNITGSANTDMNWVKATRYDASGTVISQAKQFFDYNGQVLQSQNKVFYRKNDNTVYTHVFSSQPIRDAYGRGAAFTLAAPIDYAEFNYKPDFVEASGGSAYNFKNFDLGGSSVQASHLLNLPNTSGTYQATQFIALDEGFTTAAGVDFIAEIVPAGNPIDKTNAPDKIGGQNTKGTLGWYYSRNNTWEPYTPTTDYPFSRQTFYTDGTGNVKKSAGAGESFIMGSGHEVSSYITPVINELDDYIRIRNKYFSSSEMGTLPATLKNQAIQTIARDANGKEGITIQDKGGRTLFVAKPGAELVINNSVSIPANGVHYFKQFAAGMVTVSGGSFSIKDMNTEQPVSFASGGNLPAGYYQVSNTGATAVTLAYTNGYADISYKFYNQLGQLVASIAPEGVKKLYGSNLNNYAAKNNVPFISLYEYDVRGRLVKSTSSEGGAGERIYRADGKIRFSQNAEQKINGRYSYTNYDKRGRPVESGEYIPDGNGVAFNSDLTAAVNPMKDILENTSLTGGLTSGEKKEVMMTLYDIADNSYANPNYEQDPINLRGVVSMTKKFSSILNNAPDNNNMISSSWFNYDEEGNLIWMIQFIKGLGYKTEDYSYDAQGKLVKKVFQKYVAGETFVHHYEYDAATQKLAKVYTAKTELTQDKVLQATYIYYLHGPLKRIELAGNLQGIDYTYTLQGALKAINNSDKTKDPGSDGSNGIFADAFGMVLDYHTNDYLNNRSNIQLPKGVTGAGIGQDNYAGNIKAMTWFSLKPASVVGSTPNIEDPTTYVYEYDDKNQFIEGSWYTNTPSPFTLTGYNKEKIKKPGSNIPAYDANGNILHLERTGATGTLDDRFTYNYLNTNTGSGSSTDYNSNRLESVVNDASGTPQTYASYIYDQLGQLKVEKDGNGSIKNTLIYDVTGKVIRVERNAGEPIAEYVYNEFGNRIIKKSYNSSYQLSQITYYVGNVIYTQDITGGTTYGNIVAQEYEVQGGSGRLGTYYRQDDIYAYELNDHLGNVRAVLAKSGSTMEIRVYADYYPYGMRIRGLDGYRYGYQGQYAEKDDETGWHAFELRMYDSKIARWLSIDPEGQFWSPYVAMGNDPVNNTDPDGGFTGPEDRAKAYANSYGSGAYAYAGDKGNWVVNYTGADGTIMTKNFSPTFKEKLLGIGQSIVKNTIEGVKHVGAFGAGAINAISSNNLMGAGRGNPEKFGQYAGSARAGQKFGDILTLVQSGLEYLGGAGIQVGGFALDATVVGAPVGGGLNVVGAGVWIHATAVGGTALSNLLKVEDANGEVHDASDGAGAGEAAGEEVNAVKCNDNYLKKNGIDAHALKREYLGENAPVARYDIYRDKNNGQLIIYEKGQKGEGIKTSEFIE